MGRGGDRLAKTKLPAGVRRRAGDLELKEYEAPPDIGSESHRQRLLAYARQRTARRDIQINLSHFCGRCRHSFEEHYNGGSCEECECNKYLPGGRSFTDMRGNITIQTDVPPDGPPEDRELCIAGLLRHELCHEQYTDRDTYLRFVDDLERMEREGKEIGAKQLKQLHNILEDGMIETRERRERPSSYQYIQALDRLYPRVGAVRPVPTDMRYPAPDGYVPCDADGNELKIETDAQGKRWVVVPRGTRICPWGKKPLHPGVQIISALLAETVPGFEPGELHPDVEAALEECRPHIQAAITGNTADCILRAQAIHQILRQRGLLREELTNEEREMLEQMAGAMGQMMPSAPSFGGGGAGQPQQAANGMPGGMGDGGLSDELVKQLAPGRAGEDGDKEKGDDKPQGGGKQQERGGCETGDEKDKGAGAGSGDDQGDGDGKEQDGDSGNEAGGASDDSPGGDNPSGGFDPNRKAPRASDERDESGSSKGAGEKDGTDEEPEGLTDEQLEKLREKARRNLEKDSQNEKAREEARRRAGKFEASDWAVPRSWRIWTQRELSSTSANPFPEEQGQLAALARQLSARLDRIKTEARGPQRYQRRGRLDTRRLGAAMAGNPNVFYKPGFKLNLDMEIDVSIDRSGSVTGDRFANENQYRMAKMLGIAARETKVPMTIYGWDGGSGHCGHYAYKEKHSDDLRGIDALLQTGGRGTPTAEGVRFARARLGRSKAKHRVMIVITDGAANDIPAAAEQVKAAEAQGIRVIGISFVKKEEAGSSSSYMERQFGSGNWVEIHDYLEAPRIVGRLIEQAARRAASRAATLVDSGAPTPSLRERVSEWSSKQK